MKLQVDIQNASENAVPGDRELHAWVAAALHHCRPEKDAEVSLRLVDSEEMTTLNGNFRGREGATNVLSFCSELPAELQLPLLGDIVICAPVVQREAQDQGKDRNAHWAHMTVHGTLHLLGYDHIDAADATVMETLETDILATLGYPCPYADESPRESVAR